MDSAQAFHFSTEQIASGDRLAVWREVICDQYLCLDVQPDASYPLRAELKVHHLPGTLISVIRATPMKYTRTRVQAQKGNDDFTLAWGQDTFRFRDKEDIESCALGDAALLANSATGTVDVPHQEDMLTLRLDGRMLRSAVRNFDDRPMHRLIAGSTPLWLAREYLESILRHGPLHTPLSHLAHTHVTDLVALALQPDADTRERAHGGAVPAARLAAIKADVVTNFSQVRLSAKTIAKRHGVSERYVYLLFEQNGLSFSRMVTEERLKRAMVMLLDPAYADMRIADIALAVGFGDLTTFNRAFRQRYGMTPRDTRRGP